MITHRCSGLLISKFAFKKLFRYLINCADVTRQNLVSTENDKIRMYSFDKIKMYK